jgi:hypothetical protein
MAMGSSAGMAAAAPVGGDSMAISPTGFGVTIRSPKFHSGPRWKAALSVRMRAAPNAGHATNRQRGDGSRPVGKRSGRNTSTSTASGTQIQL